MRPEYPMNVVNSWYSVARGLLVIVGIGPPSGGREKGGVVASIGLRAARP